MNNSAIQAVLLDMDGTIVDAFAPIIRALNQTFSEYGLPQMTPAQVKRHTGRGDCSMIELFGDQRESAAQRFLEIHDEDYLQRITALPGATALFQWLQAEQIPTAIVTSKSQNRAEAQLDILGWSDYFEVVIGKVEGRPEKPDPTPLLLACNHLSVTPARTVMLGDGIADMKAATRAGCMALGLCDGFSADELVAAGASHCFDTLDEVQRWLKTQIH